MFCIWAEHRVDNTEMILSLLGRAYTGPRHFLLFVLQAGEEVAGACEAGRRHSQGRGPKEAKDFLQGI